MSFSHVSLTQNGNLVTGKYHDWGVTYSNPELAGTISGVVSGSFLDGGYQDNAGDTSGAIYWPLDANGNISGGTYTLGGVASYPWCGVPAGNGTPLPDGCGWSQSQSPFNATLYPPLYLSQVADEVTGSCNVGAPVALAGVVSDYRLNIGTDINGYNSRLSFVMTRDGSQFSGNQWNPNIPAYYVPYCGSRGGANRPGTCAGGGGIFDGTWFTNLGVLTLSQPIEVVGSTDTPSSSVTGIWIPWGGDPANGIEYPLDGGVAFTGAASTALPYQQSLSWTDTSSLRGATVSGRQADEYGLSFTGQAANGLLWCGVDYGPDPFNPTPYYPDAGNAQGVLWNTEPVGTLFAGCGLTGEHWTLWPPAPGGGGSPTDVGQLTQTRGVVAGTTDSAELNSVLGVVAFDPTDGGVTVTGTWTYADLSTPDGGSFTWVPASQDQMFSGDFTFGDGGSEFEWCGSSSSTMPTPCFQ
jgi:hypothetical protein